MKLWYPIYNPYIYKVTMSIDLGVLMIIVKHIMIGHELSDLPETISNLAINIPKCIRFVTL